MRPLYLTNTLSRNKELFKPIHEGHVGMYVCGPTVYGDAHLGHARPGVTYDVLFRLLKYLGYKVRYVRNITDVGHLEHDADEGEDKIAKKARLEQLEPMEVVQYYTERYHEAMRLLNVQSPSIEPRASAHIIEQIEAIKKTRPPWATRISALPNSIWKKAEPQHIMRWPSPWGDGFPGWHLECSVMGEKYLGEEFDIHGGGMDLMFPHHECEIAQNVASRGTQGVHYWVHNNMITINGQKMGKSLGNFITLPQLFAGDHPKLEKAYSPMTIRFFILQAHYRSTLDFSNEALQAAEKGLGRLMQAWRALPKDAAEGTPSAPVSAIIEAVLDALCDDLNTPVAIAHLFDAVKLINAGGLSQADAAALCKLFDEVVGGVLGLKDEEAGASGKAEKALEGVMQLVLENRKKAREEKNWAESDHIRDLLASYGITVKDTKEGATWTLE